MFFQERLDRANQHEVIEEIAFFAQVFYPNWFVGMLPVLIRGSSGSREANASIKS